MSSVKAEDAIGAAEYRPLPMRRPNASLVARADGSFLIEQSYAMPKPWRSIPHLFAQRAIEHPDRLYVVRRTCDGDGRRGEWQGLTYRETLMAARAVAQFLIDQGIGPGRPVMALSGGSVRHAVLMLAAQIARAPFVPISTAYSLLSTDHAKLCHVVTLCRPALLFAEEGAPYAPALKAVADCGALVVSAASSTGIEAIAWDDLVATAPGDAVDSSMAAIGADTVAKVIFTSGSTGAPKGVLQTQRMLCGIIAQHDALYIPDRGVEPRHYLSWMPWSHVGASNITMCDVINEAATLHIDDGRPVPGEFEETIRNLREISLSEYSATPIFLAQLISAMEADPTLRQSFFAKLRLLGYGTAALSQQLLDRFQVLAVEETGRKVPVVTKYGSTETQGMTVVTWPLETVGPIGLPFPGITLKLAPVGDKLEIRVKGDTVTPGYVDDPEATAKAFDEEGFYRTGDAGALVDPDDVQQGIRFDGRVTENFKMSTGTWVSVGALRLALIDAMSPVVSDVVITGHDRDALGALVWLHPAGVQAMFGTGNIDMDVIASRDDVRRFLAERMRTYNRGAPGLSTRITRVMVLSKPPTGDEIAEKGYINQRATLARRKPLVEALHADPPSSDVIAI